MIVYSEKSMSFLRDLCYNRIENDDCLQRNSFSKDLEMTIMNSLSSFLELLERSLLCSYD